MGNGKEKIWVITNEEREVRGDGLTELNVQKLSANINIFIEQIGSMLEKTPEKLGKFHFDEIEVHGEVMGEGTIALFGTGGKLGATGGLKFVFRRSPTTESEGKV